MKRTKRDFTFSLSALVLALLLAAFARPALAQEATPPPDPSLGRSTTIVVPYTEYEWLLISWSENKIICRVLIDHEGLPKPKEVSKSCGEQYALEWLNTPPCDVKKDKPTTNCTGLYLHLLSSQPQKKEIVIDLPEPLVWVRLEGCTPTPPENRCATLPNLLLIGEEPLPNEQIVAIHGTIDGEPFECPGSQCRIPLQPTSLQGSSLEFWADSSYGDSSEHFTARVRVVDTGFSPAPGGGGWYVDVISTQYIGPPLSSCARDWQVFPPPGGPPTWLSTPDSPELLASAEPYYYLAGRLISEGVVDASKCASGGMLPNGYADVCGLETAKPVLEKWQNQFDRRIINVAKETGIPAQLMKNLFAQESQFWPGVFRVPHEFGLGQITDSGADVILLWNSEFYNQFCPLVLAEDTCAKGYLKLSKNEKAILRGALAKTAESDCAECLTGIDLTQTRFSVALFANTLQANCEQVLQTIFTATNKIAGEVSTYEDLWRFTVANYHAGPGCVSYAIHQAWQNDGLLNWEKVKTYFTEPCKGVVPYVDQITK